MLLQIGVLTSCAGGAGTSGGVTDAGVDARSVAPPTDKAPLLDVVPAPNDCDLLPCTGACSLACDPEQMAEKYLPPGVCAEFACPLRDGRYMIVGVCHYQ